MGPKKVAVIGAGCAGLTSLYHLSRDPDSMEPVCYERAGDLGGLWQYSENTGLDEFNQPTSSAMYKGLRTNVAKELMSFLEYPMPDDYPTFPHVEQMCTYLKNYAEHFDLKKFIRFHTTVVKVKPTKTDGNVSWEVTSRNLLTNEEETKEFDAVLVCSGWVNRAIPDIPGRDIYQGDVAHSKDYRKPGRFQDKTVVVVGMSFSGMEIMFKIADAAKKVYGIHNNYPNLFCAGSNVPSNVEQKPGIREITTDGVILNTGEFLPCDAIVFATGFHYMYPFLQEGCNISTSGDRVSPLYKHLYHIEHPSLCFLGLAKRVQHARIMGAQAAHVCKVLRGDISLPTEEEMRRDEEEDYQTRIVQAGQQRKMTHDMFGDEQWRYFRFLEGENSQSGGKMAENYFNYHIPLWMNRFHNFQEVKINIVDDETFTTE